MKNTLSHEIQKNLYHKINEAHKAHKLIYESLTPMTSPTRRSTFKNEDIVFLCIDGSMKSYDSKAPLWFFQYVLDLTSFMEDALMLGAAPILHDQKWIDGFRHRYSGQIQFGEFDLWWNFTSSGSSTASCPLPSNTDCRTFLSQIDAWKPSSKHETVYAQEQYELFRHIIPWHSKDSQRSRIGITCAMNFAIFHRKTSSFLKFGSTNQELVVNLDYLKFIDIIGWVSQLDPRKRSPYQTGERGLALSAAKRTLETAIKTQQPYAHHVF